MTSPSRSLAMCRAINANLTNRAGERRALEERNRREDEERARRKMERERRASHIGYLRNERTRLRAALRDLDATEADMRNDSFYIADAGRLQGALEELEMLRETSANRLARIESDLRMAGRA